MLAAASIMQEPSYKAPDPLPRDEDAMLQRFEQVDPGGPQMADAQEFCLYQVPLHKSKQKFVDFHSCSTYS